MTVRALKTRRQGDGEKWRGRVGRVPEARKTHPTAQSRMPIPDAEQMTNHKCRIANDNRAFHFGHSRRPPSFSRRHLSPIHKPQQNPNQKRHPQKHHHRQAVRDVNRSRHHPPIIVRRSVPNSGSISGPCNGSCGSLGIVLFDSGLPTQLAQNINEEPDQNSPTARTTNQTALSGTGALTRLVAAATTQMTNNAPSKPEIKNTHEPTRLRDTGTAANNSTFGGSYGFSSIAQAPEERNELARGVSPWINPENNFKAPKGATPMEPHRLPAFSASCCRLHS